MCFPLALSSAFAGSIGFAINFTGDEVAITNTGSEAAYQLSEWTLDSSSQWRQVQVQEGNPAYLAPGKSLKGRRFSSAATTGFGRADPILVVLHDQAGSRIAQLAWRQPPAVQQQPLPTRRSGGQLSIDAGAARAQKIVATYGVVVPYDGIKRLTQPLVEAGPPPNPQRHAWAAGAPMVMNTGAGQGGAWLVHESATGDLRVQIVPDGLIRGQEQVPGWLVWARQYLMKLSALLAGVGLTVMFAGFIRAARRSRSLDGGLDPQ